MEKIIKTCICGKERTPEEEKKMEKEFYEYLRSSQIDLPPEMNEIVNRRWKEMI